jgi:predicted SAM-dependent methyltransferase
MGQTLMEKMRGLGTKLKWFGLRYRCPLCRSWLKTFQPFGQALPVFTEKRVVGAGFRLNAVCPICHSLDRERLIYLFLRHRTNLFTNPNKLLHIAAEPRLSYILKSNPAIDYLTADLQKESAIVKMDVTQMPFQDASFDAIICNHVLEHVTKDVEAIAELYRVLKPGGWAILQVPISLCLDTTFEAPSITSDQGRQEAFGQANHVRLYGRDFGNRLTQAGFALDIFSWADGGRKFGGSANIYGLIKDESVYFARKPRQSHKSDI